MSSIEHEKAGLHRRPQRGRRRRRRLTWRGRVVVGVVGVLVLGAAAVGGTYLYADYRFHQIHREAVRGLVPIQHSRGGDDPYNVLLVGDNCRYCLNKSDGVQYGAAASIAGGRSDVTMVMHVDPRKNRASILSIPRDLWLPIPGTTKQIRVDAALNDGPGELVTTIEDDLDIPINHYIEFNFDTFKDVVNAIGGIEMDFPDRVYDSYSKLSAPAGCYHLDGEQALAVVRARHLYYEQGGTWDYDGLGDISRIQRDHEFIRVLGAAVRAQGLGDPLTDNDFVELAAKDLQIDNRFTLSSLLDLAETMSHTAIAKSPQRTLPVDEDNSPNGFVFAGAQYGDVVFPTWAADEKSIRALLGVPLPGAGLAASAVPVRLIDVSGVAGTAQRTGTGLRALGFPVTGESIGTVTSTPAETVVYYGRDHEAEAQRVADDLDGAVALAFDPGVAGSGVTVATGTDLGVSRPARVGGTTGPTAPARPKAVGDIVTANPRYPSFDPRSCVRGAKAPDLPAEAVPPSAALPQT